MNSNIGDFSAWLIEYVGAQPCPVYVPQYNGGFYTCNPWIAMRFDTREKAAAYITKHNYNKPWVAIEHGFTGVV